MGWMCVWDMEYFEVCLDYGGIVCIVLFEFMSGFEFIVDGILQLYVDFDDLMYFYFEYIVCMGVVIDQLFLGLLIVVYFGVGVFMILCYIEVMCFGF